MGTPQPTTAKKDIVALFEEPKVAERLEQLWGDHADVLREASYAVQIISADDRLMQCSAASKQMAVINAANVKLTLAPFHKLAYLIARYNTSKRCYECGFEPSYMGLMKLATDAGVRHFESQKVYQGDRVTIDKGMKTVSHVPYWQLGHEKGELVAVYAIATLFDGSVLIEDIGAEELATIRGVSETYKAWKEGKIKNAPHALWQDEMDRKSVIRRLCKSLPRTDRTEALMRAIQYDEADFTVEADPSADTLSPLKRQIREAFDFYQGEDAAELRELCRNKVTAGEFDETFARNMLAQLGVQQLG